MRISLSLIQPISVACDRNYDAPRRIFHTLHFNRREIEQRFANALQFLGIRLTLSGKLYGLVWLGRGGNG